MRVVINGRFLTQVRTGVQRYATETLLALDQILDDRARPSNLDFELAIPLGTEVIPLRNIRCVEVGSRQGHLWEQFDLWRHARGAFLVNFNYSGPLAKRDQLITIHDATVPAMPHGFSRAYRWVHTAMVAVLGRRARSVMTVSKFSRDEIRTRFGLKRDDIVVGVEGGEHVRAADADADTDELVLRKHGLEAGRYVLGVGSVKPNKNFDLIAQALRLLPGFPWPVAIAGAKDIGIFRDASSLSDSFVFLGFVSDEDLAVLYRHAACFVFPSSYEGFGLPAMEAMALDCPVLCARSSAMPEVCGDAVLYFDHDDPHSLADALLRFYSDPSLRDTLVAAGRGRLAHYNWRHNARILRDHLVALAPRPLVAPQARRATRLSAVAASTTAVVAADTREKAVAVVPPKTTARTARGAVKAAAPAAPKTVLPVVAPASAPAPASRSAASAPLWHADHEGGEEMLPEAADGVLHVTECLASGTLSFLLQATAEMLRAGVPQTVLFSRRPDTPADVERRFDWRVRLLEIPPLSEVGVLRYFRRLRESLDAELALRRYKAVHLHSSKAGFLGRMALARRERPALFYSPHGLSFLDRKYVFPSLVFGTLERLAARVDATLVGCSQGEAALLSKLGRCPVRVVENAVPDDFFAIDRQSAKPPVVMTMGRICRQKAPEVFAELAARFHIAEIPATFVWVGDGDAGAQAMLRAAGVKVTGWLSPEQVRQHLASASVYVQTSLWEGMPLSVLQALAAGLPCVVTDVVGNRDAVRQGITGYVARHPEAIAMSVRRLLLDPALYARMSRAARADAAERFAARNLRANLLRLYGLGLSETPRESLAEQRLPDSVAVDIVLPVGDLALRSGRGASPHTPTTDRAQVRGKEGLVDVAPWSR